MADMTDTPTSTETRPPLADLLANGPVRADPPRRSRRAGIWLDKLEPLVSLPPNEWYLIEQFTRLNQAENAATNLRRANANKPPLQDGWTWEFSSATFPHTGAEKGHSSLYARIVAPDVVVQPSTPLVREERTETRTKAVTPVPSVEPDEVPAIYIGRNPGYPVTIAPEDLARPASSEPDPAVLALPEESGWESLKAENDTVTDEGDLGKQYLDTVTAPRDLTPDDEQKLAAALSESDWESLKAENDTMPEKAPEAANEPTDDEISF